MAVEVKVAEAYQQLKSAIGPVVRGEQASMVIMTAEPEDRAHIWEWSTKISSPFLPNVPSSIVLAAIEQLEGPDGLGIKWTNDDLALLAEVSKGNTSDEPYQEATLVYDTKFPDLFVVRQLTDLSPLGYWRGATLTLCSMVPTRGETLNLLAELTREQGINAVDELQATKEDISMYSKRITEE